MAVVYRGLTTAGGGRGTAANRAGVQGRGEIDATRVEFLGPQIEREHRITLPARKGTAPPTTATSLITSAAMAGATITATTTREGDRHYYLLNVS